MKKILLVMMFAISLPQTIFTSSHSIIFVHLGTADIPKYASIAIKQARLFNPNCPFYFIAQQNQIPALSRILKQYNVTCVAAESLTTTVHHKNFIQTSRLDSKWHHGFWKYTTERFFYIEELMMDYKIGNAFHIENDIMLYVDLESLLSTFQKHYRGIGITFGSDNMCVAGFAYIPTAESLRHINIFLGDNAFKGEDDGITLAKCKNTVGREYIDYLPTVCREYSQYYEMKNTFGEKPISPEAFSLHLDDFNSIFDAAALGQFLGGWSPLNTSWNDGKACKNFWSIFDASNIQIIWEQDELQRRVPFALFKGTKYRINNLHIHSKNLQGFCS